MFHGAPVVVSLIAELIGNQYMVNRSLHSNIGPQIVKAKDR